MGHGDPLRPNSISADRQAPVSISHAKRPPLGGYVQTRQRLQNPTVTCQSAATCPDFVSTNYKTGRRSLQATARTGLLNPDQPTREVEPRGSGRAFAMGLWARRLSFSVAALRLFLANRRSTFTGTSSASATSRRKAHRDCIDRRAPRAIR